jgi:predicted ribosomally synthesized peptide with SipW-like signal peptide
MRAIWLSVSVLVMSAALAVFIIGATLAPLSDSETSTGNTVAAGTLDLKLSDKDEDFGDGVSESWKRLNVSPGDDLQCATITLKNVGSLPGASTELYASNSIIDPPGPESDTGDGTTTGLEMAAYVEITSLIYDSGNILPQVDPTRDGVEGRSLADLELQGGIQGLAGLIQSPPNGTNALAICLLFRADAGNDFQGKTLLTDLIFTLRE